MIDGLIDFNHEHLQVPNMNGFLFIFNKQLIKRCIIVSQYDASCENQSGKSLFPLTSGKYKLQYEWKYQTRKSMISIYPQLVQLTSTPKALDITNVSYIYQNTVDL